MRRSMREVFRWLLVLAALDSLLAGAWAVAWPADRAGSLFALLNVEPPRDAFLWRGLGGLLLTHVVCLALAAWRPARWGGLALVPLIGRALQCGVWLWLRNTDRVHLPAGVLDGLLVHDVIWLPILAGFLYLARPEDKAPLLSS
jgi:hypothetical protein